MVFIKTEVSCKQARVICPICQAPKVVKIPDYVFQEKQEGSIIKIHVYAQGSCEHNYVAFVDQNGAVRGYERIDFQTPLGGPESEEVSIPVLAAIRDFLAKIDGYVSGSYAQSTSLPCAQWSKRRRVVIWSSQTCGIGSPTCATGSHGMPRRVRFLRKRS